MHPRTLPLVFALAGLTSTSAPAADPASSPRFRATPTADAWNLLPREDPPLPAWARVLVRPLPRTTAGMLDLDHTQREKNPLGPVLAAKVRRAAHDVLGCDYGKRVAEADLRRAGVTDEEVAALDGDPREWSPEDRLVLGFARKLTKAGHSITDREVAALVERLGPGKVVGIVHTVAYANFHARVCLGLGVAVEEGGPPPAVAVNWDREKLAKVAAPPRREWKDVFAADVPDRAFITPDWEEVDFDALVKRLDTQKARKARIPDPPPGKGTPSKVVWSRLSLGYQPLLTQTWFNTMRTFQEEAGFDRVFSNSVFWVVTRTNDCFY